MHKKWCLCKVQNCDYSGLQWATVPPNTKLLKKNNVEPKDLFFIKCEHLGVLALRSFLTVSLLRVFTDFVWMQQWLCYELTKNDHLRIAKSLTSQSWYKLSFES